MTNLSGLLSAIAVGACLLSSTIASAADLPDAEPVPGGIALVALPPGSDDVQVTFNRKPVLLTSTGNTITAVIGLPLSTKPGIHTLSLKTRNGRKTTLDFQVNDKQYESQHITLKNKRQVNPEKRDMVRIGREQKRIRKALAHYDRQRPERLRFLIPVDAPVSSPSVYAVFSTNSRASLTAAWTWQRRQAHRSMHRQVGASAIPVISFLTATPFSSTMARASLPCTATCPASMSNPVNKSGPVTLSAQSAAPAG